MSFSDETYIPISHADRFNINTFSGKFGIQYFQPVGKNWNFGIGGTYKLGSKVNGSIENDGMEGKLSDLRLGSEIGVGLSAYYMDKLKLEFDYINSDWTKSGFENDPFFSVNESSLPFKSAVGQSFRLGAEFVPDRRDTRYYLKKVAYRAGLFYNNEYYTVGGNRIDAKGITIGATFPVFNMFNSLTVAFDFGQRGSLSNSLVRENYFNVSVAVNLYDRWFRKMQYE